MNDRESNRPPRDGSYTDSLPSRESQVAYFEHLEDALDGFFDERAPEALSWCFRPQLHMAFERDRRRRTWGRSVEYGHRLTRHLARKSGVVYYRLGEVVFAFHTVNQAKVLEPIMRLWEQKHRVARARIRPQRDLPLWLEHAKRAHALARDLDKWSSKRFPYHNPTLIEATALMAATSLSESTGALSQTPTALVVANQHSVHPRAAIWTAQHLEIPTVYVAHAPVADNRQYADLPTSYAGLWGNAEVEWYSRLAVDPDRLTVVGNPAVPRDDPPPIDPQLPPVVALSDHSPATNAELIRFVARSLPGPVTLVLHPATNRRRLRRAIPGHWRLAPAGTTYEQLLKAPPFVIQHSSGVAREALSLGLPTIELSFPGQKPNYPLIREPRVRLVSSVDELKDAMRAATAEPYERQKLIDWAEEWSSPRGDEASRRGVDLIQEATSQAAPDIIWDAWAPEA